MTVRDSGGNVAVDFVWGNFPLQPNDDRGENTLDASLDNHVIATTGYANFPSFIPNYAGDGDTGLETVVPNFVGLTWPAANAAATAASLVLNAQWYTPVITAAVTSGKTATLTLDNDYLLKAGMTISGYLDNGTTNMTFVDGKIKSITNGGTTVVITAKTAFANDVEWTTQNSYLYDNFTGTDTRPVLWQQNGEGQILDSGSTVLVAALQNND